MRICYQWLEDKNVAEEGKQANVTDESSLVGVSGDGGKRIDGCE